MRLGIFGTGYAGLVTAVGLAEVGHTVTAIDKDPDIYLVNPGTAFHVGYTDRYENLAVAPGSPPSLFRSRSPDLSVGRQVFVKLSYLWRF